MLSSILTDEILQILSRSGLKVVVCAEILVILASGIFRLVISLTREGAKCGFGINSTRTELILFAWHKKLSLSSNAKYRSVIPNRKLNWRLSIKLTIKKVCIVQKKFFVRKWGPQPRRVLYMFTVRPICQYFIEWWPVLNKKKRKKRKMIQKAACARGSIVAVLYCPLEAINIA